MTAADDLLAFIDASPSPYHAVAAAAERLSAAGFADATAGPIPATGGAFLRNGGALLAWRLPAGDTDPAAPFRIIGAHTDSPNLRLKPRPDLGGSGFRRLAAEPYGGALLNSWLDRDLGLSGRVTVADGNGGVEERLFRSPTALLRVPQLAIHLDRDVTTSGLVLDKQRHLNPVWGLGTPTDGDFVDWLAGQVGVEPGAVRSWDAMVHDTVAPARLGLGGELLSAPRLDNLCSCFGAVEALRTAVTSSIAVIALFDHEEIGSETATGAASPVLGDLLERIRAVLGSTTEDRARSLERSRILSADMAHGTHPNYPERHEPNHPIRLGGGPVVKVNVNGRYVTDARTAAEFHEACRAADVPTQVYAHRADLACGSTIGPISAARLGIPTVDVGLAQLSMHSARELMAADDVDHMVAAFRSWLRVQV